MAVGYGPLSGVTVVDLTQFLSGPLATMIMADLGADVIKVERPDRPKASGPFLNGERVYDLSVQRSKKSITLNLKAETDKKVLLELVKKADVLVENFKPGTMERMGLGYHCRSQSQDHLYGGLRLWLYGSIPFQRRAGYDRSGDERTDEPDR